MTSFPLFIPFSSLTLKFRLEEVSISLLAEAPYQMNLFLFVPSHPVSNMSDGEVNAGSLYLHAVSYWVGLVALVSRPAVPSRGAPDYVGY